MSARTEKNELGRTLRSILGRVRAEGNIYAVFVGYGLCQSTLRSILGLGETEHDLCGLLA